MPSLGFSTFVRNEIQALPGLIENVLGEFDYYVVVDTGSNDGTWAFLTELVAKGAPLHIYRLGIPFDAHHFRFGDVRSAAAHLNKADWVMMLDADERMDGIGQLRLEVEFARGKGELCVAFPRHRWTDGPDERKAENKKVYPDLQARLIKNDGNVWWRRPVHEVVLVKGAPPKMRTSELHIHHHHEHFRALKGDDGSYHHIYKEMEASDPEWAGTY